MKIEISKTLFSPVVLQKVSYQWQKDFSMVISENENNYIVSLDDKAESFLQDKFINDLQEQQLRENLNNQFGEIRNTIYRKAFELFDRHEI